MERKMLISRLSRRPTFKRFDGRRAPAVRGTFRASLVGALVTGILAGTGFAGGAGAAELRLLSSFNSTQKPTYAVLERYIENVKAIGGDAVKIKISGPEVVPIFEQLQPVASGVFDMLYTHPVFHAGEGGLALTVKAGGNLRHSHNDVGSFAVGLGGTQPLGDPGGPAHYDGQSFGPQRYERPVESSFGHPVPVIDGQYQVDATTITPAVLARSSDPDRETITIDMTPAYDVPGLEAFHRTVEYHRGDGGRIVIRDKFDLSRPMRIVESFPTHGRWQQGSPRSVGFALDDARVVLTFDGVAPQNIVADRVSQNGTRFEVLRAAFDLAGESVVEMSISPRTGAGRGN